MIRAAGPAQQQRSWAIAGPRKTGSETLGYSPAMHTLTLATLGLLLASFALIILTIAVNLMANFVAPALALTNLLPRKLNFRTAALVSAGYESSPAA